MASSTNRGKNPDDEPRFRTAPGFFPTANVPVWVTMHPDCDEGCIAIAQFIIAYRNSTDGRLPYVKRATVMKRFGKGKDWLDRRTKILERIGFLTKVATYRDILTGERTDETHAADGTPNPQTSNDWMIHDTPPAGDAHPYPIQSSEFDRQDRIEERINERARLIALAERGGAPQRPGAEQGKQEFSQFEPPALHSASPRRSTAPRSGAPQRPKLELDQRELTEPDKQPGASNDASSPSSAVPTKGSACLPDSNSPNEPTTDGDPYEAGRRLLRAASKSSWPKPLGKQAVDQYAPLVTELVNERGEKDTLNRLIELATEGNPRNPAGQLRNALKDLAESRAARKELVEKRQKPAPERPAPNPPEDLDERARRKANAVALWNQLEREKRERRRQSQEQPTSSKAAAS